MYRVAQGKNPVDDLWAERGALFGGEVSRNPEGGLPVVHLVQRGVNRH